LTGLDGLLVVGADVAGGVGVAGAGLVSLEFGGCHGEGHGRRAVGDGSSGARAMTRVLGVARGCV
jgi:hypothetical protein